MADEVPPKLFVKIPQDLLRVPRKTLGATAKLAYAAIVDRIGVNTSSWPGERRIAEDIGSTRQAVSRALIELERAGLLVIERGSGPRGSHRYRLPTGTDSLPVTNCDMSQNDTTTGAVSLHRPATFRGHNQTKEPDQSTRPSDSSSDASIPIVHAGQRKPSKFDNPLRIDLDRTARQWTGISDADWTAWAAAYPAVEVRSEALRALEWCLANPAKGKKSNYRRFITNWFQRTQDRGGSGGAGPAQRGPANLSRVHTNDPRNDYSKNVIDCSADDPEMPWA